MSGQLNIVDQNGQIVGVEDRAIIHQQGLLHKEVNVWLYTSKSEIIFQHRSRDKDTYPDLLDASASGHVEIGGDWDNSAIKELLEETGIQAKVAQLTYIAEIHLLAHDHTTGLINNSLRRNYALKYDQPLSLLRAEPGKILGFEAWPIAKLLNISKAASKHFIPAVFHPDYLTIFKQIQALIAK